MLFFWKKATVKVEVERRTGMTPQVSMIYLPHEIPGSRTGFKFLHTVAILLVFHQDVLTSV